jgi:hypothetical protein
MKDATAAKKEVKQPKPLSAARFSNQKRSPLRKAFPK